MARKTKRIILIGDFHSGHLAGTTPPDFQWRIGSDDAHRDKIARAQSELWNWYKGQMKQVGKPYAVLCNGDMIDGTGSRSGGTEQVTTDRNAQVAMALQCIKSWKADRHVLTHGTSYHTGSDGEDFEGAIADSLGCKIGSHEWIDINGLIIDLRHHVGSSGIPHGRFTALAKQKLWNALWARDEAQPDAQVIVRSHVHYHAYCGGAENGEPWLAMTLPAMQLANTKYGARRCDGIVNVGFVVMDVKPSGSYSWNARIAKLQHNKAQTYPL